MHGQDSFALIGLAAGVFLIAGLAVQSTWQSVRRYGRTRVLETETTTSRQARWCDDGYFELPVPVPGPTFSERLRIEVDRGSYNAAPLRFACAPRGAVRIMGCDAAGTLLHVSGVANGVAHLAFVYVVDPSTGRPALLRVPPGIKTPTEGVAWTFGIDSQEWAPVMET